MIFFLKFNWNLLFWCVVDMNYQDKLSVVFQLVARFPYVISLFFLGLAFLFKHKICWISCGLSLQSCTNWKFVTCIEFSRLEDSGGLSHREFQRWQNGGGAFHKSACIDPTAVIETGAIVHPKSVVGAYVHIGSGTVIGPSVTVGQLTKIGWNFFTQQYKNLIPCILLFNIMLHYSDGDHMVAISPHFFTPSHWSLVQKFTYFEEKSWAYYGKTHFTVLYFVAEEW